MAGVYTVTQINSYIKNMFRQDFVLNRIQIKGEISNCKYHTSGHIYFTLKDSGGTIAVVMFASYASKLDIKLENGMSVVVDGRIDIYERDGRYQLYAVNITESGMGDLYKKFEQLKQQYDDMGYFDSSYKRPIPRFARKIRNCNSFNRSCYTRYNEYITQAQSVCKSVSVSCISSGRICQVQYCQGNSCA